MRGVATEAQIQKAILDGLAARHVFAFRLNTGAGLVKGRPIHHHTLGKGAADILAFPRTLKVPIPYPNGTRWIDGASAVLWLEVKTAKGCQSPEQRTFEIMVRDYGQDYLLARSWDDVAAWLKERGL